MLRSLSNHLVSWHLTLVQKQLETCTLSGENWAASKTQAELLGWDARLFLMAAHCAAWSLLTSSFRACHRGKLLGSWDNPTVGLCFGCCCSVQRDSWAGSSLGCVQRPGDKYQQAGRFLCRQSSVSLTVFHKCMYKNNLLSCWGTIYTWPSAAESWTVALGRRRGQVLSHWLERVGQRVSSRTGLEPLAFFSRMCWSCKASWGFTMPPSCLLRISPWSGIPAGCGACGPARATVYVFLTLNSGSVWAHLVMHITMTCWASLRSAPYTH